MNHPLSAQSLQAISRIASLCVITMGCVVFVGWLFDIAVLKSILPGLVTMKANTAIGFIFAGTSLWLWHQRSESATYKHIALFCGAIALLIGLLTLIQYSFSVNLGIDQLIFQESVTAVATATPGRMAPNTAFNFLLLGSALVLLGTPKPHYLAAQLFTLVAFLIALFGFLGYLYGNAYFYKLSPSYTAMAVHTAVAFLWLCIGILLARPDVGIMSILTRADAGGLMAQRLVPAALVAPPLLCWLILLGYRAQTYTPEMGISLLGILNAILFVVAIALNARNLGSLDTQRRRAELALKQAFADLENRVREREQMAGDLQAVVQQVTAVMNQLEADSKNTATQAIAADRQAKEALNLSEMGTVAVERTQQEMQALQAKVEAIATEIRRTQQLSKQVGEISRLVGELANQTNLLALNATIEAVRAGEQGKGFGVVAAEIRKLADASKQSAQRISGLIEDIQKAIAASVKVTQAGIETVHSGVAISQETAEAIGGIAQAIDQIFLANQHISLTANQQAAAIQQVVTTLNSIDTQTLGSQRV